MTSYIKRDEIAVNYTHTHSADGDRLYSFAYLFKYALDIAGAKTVTLPNDSDIIVMAASVSEIGNAEASPLALIYDKAEISEVPKYKLTTENSEGGGMYAEGQMVVVRAKQYENGKILSDWIGDCIVTKHNAGVLVRMPAHDLTVKAVIGEIEKDSVLRNKPCKANSMRYEHELPAFALDGTETSKWCTREDEGLLTVK